MRTNKLHLQLLTAFGLGNLWPAPGTWGSLPPVALAMMLVWVASASQSSAAFIALVDVPLIIIALLSAWVCLQFGSAGEQHFGRKDPSQVVSDEVCGQSIALLFLPWHDVDLPGAWKWNLIVAATAFIAFRLIDITKPPPARRIQKYPGGMGILMDDVIAGVYALIIAQIAARFLWPLAV